MEEVTKLFARCSYFAFSNYFHDHFLQILLFFKHSHEYIDLQNTTDEKKNMRKWKCYLTWSTASFYSSEVRDFNAFEFSTWPLIEVKTALLPHPHPFRVLETKLFKYSVFRVKIYIWLQMRKVTVLSSNKLSEEISKEESNKAMDLPLSWISPNC